jgi:hypothetical protein
MGLVAVAIAEIGARMAMTGRSVSAKRPGIRRGDQVGTDVGTDVILRDTDGNVFGTFPSGTTVKYTEANGATPSGKKIGSANGQASAVDCHINGTGDLVVVSVDPAEVTCPVPPPPK